MTKVDGEMPAEIRSGTGNNPLILSAVDADGYRLVIIIGYIVTTLGTEGVFSFYCFSALQTVLLLLPIFQLFQLS